MKKLLLFVILTNMISCYTYVNDELPRIRAIKPKIKLDSISFRITGIENKNDLKAYNSIVREKMEKSGLFQIVNSLDVNEKLDKADKHHLEIHLKPIDIFENNWLFGISFIPFITPLPVPGLVPAFKQNKIAMLVDYYVDGKLKRYDKFYQSSTTLVGIIPLVMRTKNGDSVDKPDLEIVNNFTDNAIFYLNELNFSESVQ
jgi:hypothetical protein